MRLKADVTLFIISIIWGVAFVAQRHTLPADADLISSLESEFAVLAGWLLLDEKLYRARPSGALSFYCSFAFAIRGMDIGKPGS